MIRSARWSLAVGVVAVALLAAGSAAAQEPPRPVAVAATQGAGVGIPSSAPAAVKERIARALSGATDVRTPQRAGRRSWIGCRSVYAWRGYNNPAGMSLFRYYQQVSWCSNGFGIYSWSRERWPEISG